MSDLHATSPPPGDRERWEAVLNQLRADGFSPVESIKITRAVLDVPLGEAKSIVHASRVWADLRDATSVGVRPRPICHSTSFVNRRRDRR